jgi:hypothetical protein
MTVQELFTKWGFDVDMKPLQQLEKNMAGLQSKVNAVGLAAVAAAGTMFGFAKFTADAGDQALHTAEMLGLNVETLQKLQFAAKLANIESGEFAGGMRFLSRNLLAAQQGSGDAAKAFQRLKLDPKSFKSGDQALRAIADRFQTLPEGPERAALAMQLFGRSGASMVPFLKQGSAAIDEAGAKAEKYGIVLSEAQARAADEFNDTLDESKAALTGVRNILGNALIPEITKLMRAFADYMAQNRDIIAQNIGKVFQVLGKFVNLVTKAAVGAVEIFGNLAKAFGGTGNVLEYLNKGLDYLLMNPMFLKVLGATTLAVYGLATAFGVLNLKAMAIPLAIAALVGVIALIAEDIMAFTQGRDSALGLLLDFFKTKFPNAFKFFGSIFEGLVSIFKVFFNLLSSLLGILFKIGSVIVGVVVEAFKKLGQAVSFLVEKLGIGSIAAALGGAFKSGAQATADFTAGAADQVGVVGGLRSIEPGSAPAQSGSVQANQNNQNNINLNISVPPGANPNDIAGAARTGVTDGLESVLRQSNRTFKSGVAY